MNPHSQKLQGYALLILRIGMAFVFFWFGYKQLVNPAGWVSLLPEWTSSLPLSATKFILLNGLLEIVGATLLLLGAYTRIVAFILAVHLFGIASTFGLSPAGVRDYGLAIATLSLFISGAGVFSIDNKGSQS